MDVETLTLFVDVARRAGWRPPPRPPGGGRRGGAPPRRDRGVDPSVVSRAIAGLEASLGARLFQRTTRAMVLTEAGELYLARLPAILDDLARVRDEAASMRADPVGTLRLTAPVAFAQLCLLPHLPDFRASFPRLKLELMLTDRSLDLVAERVDLAIRLRLSERGDVTGVKLFDTRYRVVASTGYVGRHGAPGHPSELSGRECLRFGAQPFRTRWLFQDEAGQVEVPVDGPFLISSGLAIRQATLDGLGPALLPGWLVGEDVAQGRLADLFPAHEVSVPGVESTAWLLYPSREYLPGKTRSVIAFLRDRLKPLDAAK